MISFKIIILVCVISMIEADRMQRIANVEGDVSVALLINNCQNASEEIPYRAQTMVSSAIWATERINYLRLLSTIKLGLAVYEACVESDYYKVIFDLYELKNEYLLGIISDNILCENILKLCEVLNIPTQITKSHHSYLVKASVQFMSAIGWDDNLTVFLPHQNLAREFYDYSQKTFLCVKDWIIDDYNGYNILSSFTNPVVFFGYQHHIEEFTRRQNRSDDNNEINILFIPLDGSVPKDSTENTYIMLPPHTTPSTIYKKLKNILPTPLLFEIAGPILTYAKTIEKHTMENCNDTFYKLNCLKRIFTKNYQPISLRFNPAEIVEVLSIEPLKDLFVYNIFKIENELLNMTELAKKNDLFQPYTKIFTYNIFSDELIVMKSDFGVKSGNISKTKCIRYFLDQSYIHTSPNGSVNFIYFRNDSWIYALLSLSFLGILLCIFILIFLVMSIFRRDILEGNPILTLSLLVSVMLLFSSVVPFSLESHDHTKYHLCLLRSLLVTTSYALVFSLLLSRCILLATASKEIGLMSHIAGPVQAFLCLFIFGVQAALNLQLRGRCPNVFQGYQFIYLLCYNILILLLLLCLCPLIYKCKRNYREGKYFTFAIVLTCLAWCIWLPCYAVLDGDWKEPVLCLGLLTTGAILLGAIFIPRTYLITIAAAKEKIANTLPSLSTATSAMDIYRANTQPIYDCVNVAAINAVTVARAGVATGPSMRFIQQPDLYTYPALPDDEDYNIQCDTPPNTDKVTRF